MIVQQSITVMLLDLDAMFIERNAIRHSQTVSAPMAIRDYPVILKRTSMRASSSGKRIQRCVNDMKPRSVSVVRDARVVVPSVAHLAL